MKKYRCSCRTLDSAVDIFWGKKITGKTSTDLQFQLGTITEKWEALIGNPLCYDLRPSRLYKAKNDMITLTIFVFNPSLKMSLKYRKTELLSKINTVSQTTTIEDLKFIFK